MTRPSDPDRWARIESILDRALDLEGAARDAYLDEACDDPSLRSEVEELLRAAEGSGPLDAPLHRLAGTLTEEAGDQLQPSYAEGRRVGPWRIVDTLGTGGMGRVFLAERADGAFEQQCALKVMRWEMASDALVQRFRSERQILADLEHPSLARLIDGGVTEEGLPYLAMEKVDGEPIDVYCDRHAPSIRERLGLFCAAAEAVQFAHRNLVVHRDLKPNNILVTGEGQVKLLDFGVAKIVDETGVGDATHTHLAPVTPHYAAPEQLTARPITTATDVWALGVLLYRLICGVTPFETVGESVTQLTRRVLEEEVAPPSERVEASLRRAVQGDLDTIVRKALRKEPGRRYGSVERMVEDIQRHLEGQPISAQPATWRYRSGKFARRHRRALAAAAVIVVTIGGLVGFYTQRLANERDRARQESLKTEQVTNFVLSMFESNDPLLSRGEEITARELLDRGAERIPIELEGQPAIEAEMHDVVAGLYRELGVYDEANAHFEQAVAIRRDVQDPRDPDLANSLEQWGFIRQELDDLDAAEAMLREALAIRRAHPADVEGLATACNQLGLVLSYEGNYDEAEPLLREAVALREELFGPETAPVATALNNLGLTLKWKGDFDAAEPIYRRVLAIREKVLGKEAPEYAISLDNLGVMLGQRGDYDESERCFQEALSIRTKVLGEDHPDVALNLNNLATLYRVQGRLDDAEPIYRRVLEMNVRLLGEDHRRVATNLVNLGSVQVGRGQYADAVGLFRRALAIRRASLGDDHIDVAIGLNNLANALKRQGNHRDADEAAAEAVRVARRAVDEKSIQLAQILRNHGDILLLLGKDREAETVLREALSIQEEELAPRHGETAASRTLLGASLISGGDYAQAEQLLLAGMEVLQDEDDEWSLQRGRGALRDLYTAWGKPDLAQRYQP